MDDETTRKLPPETNRPGTATSRPAMSHWHPFLDQTTTRLIDPQAPLAPKRSQKKRTISPIRLALSIFGIFLLLGCGGLSLAYYFYTNSIQQPLGQFIRPVGRGNDEPALNTTPTYDVIKGRSWNILLMGSDNDGKYNFPAVLTQVMMLVHIDTVNNTVHMVSIPRDSWVALPNQEGMHKIDQAFFLGVTQHNNSFDEGVRLARLTVEKDYGVPIDRYAWVGLSGFAKVIDTLGGVDVDITHPIVDDTYPDDTGNGANPNDPNAYKRLSLAPGPQHLSGATALEYVRSRHADLVGDVGRTQRQQQVLEALKLKLNVSSVISNLAKLINDLKGQVYTDLNQAEMLAFANYGRTLPGKALQRLTLGFGTGDQNFGEQASIYDPTIGAQQDVILPHCNTIQPIVNRIFALGDVPSCHVKG